MHLTPQKNVIELKWLHSFIFKVYGPKYIEVSDIDKFKFWSNRETKNIVNS